MVGAGLFRLFARFEIVGEPAPTAIDSLRAKGAHFPILIKLYRVLTTIASCLLNVLLIALL